VYQTKFNAATMAEAPDQSCDEASWQYCSPTGGINNSVAAVVAKAASTVNRGGDTVPLRNYVTSIHVHNEALGAQSEVLVLSNATVLWRGRVGQTYNAGVPIQFSPALKPTPGDPIKVQVSTLTVTGGVYFNINGYVGS